MLRVYLTTVLITWIIFVVYFNLYANDFANENEFDHDIVSFAPLLLAIVPLINLILAFFVLVIIITDRER